MTRAGDRLLIFLVVLLLGMAVAAHFYTAYYGDKQWEMLYAQMWLQGKVLYRDIVPVSPPLIFWMYALPAKLSSLGGFADGFTLLIVVGLGCVAFSIILSTCLIARHPAFAGNKRRLAGFVALLCFLLIFRTSPIYFLDREHLFFVFTLPYLLRFSPGLDHKHFAPWLRAALGVLAAIGFCIKPYCLVVWLGIQLLCCIRHRSPRTLLYRENLIIYAGGIFYVILVASLTPEYFTLVLPMALLTYGATRDPVSTLDYSSNALSVLVLTFLMFRMRYDSPYRKDIGYLAGLCPFFYAYALLNNNWAYTYYPLSTIALLLTGYVLIEFFYLRRHHRALGLATWTFSMGIAACLLTIAIRVAISLNYFYHVGVDHCHLNPACKGDDIVMADLQSDNGPLSFGAITIDFDRWTRVSLYAHAAWVTRFPQLWMLPRFFLADNKDFARDHRWILDYVAEAYAEDMERNKPDIMFVDDSDAFYTAVRHVDLVGYFSANSDFSEAMGHYRYIHRIDLCGRRLRIMRRIKSIAAIWCINETCKLKRARNSAQGLAPPWRR